MLQAAAWISTRLRTRDPTRRIPPVCTGARKSVAPHRCADPAARATPFPYRAFAAAFSGGFSPVFLSCQQPDT